MKPARILLLVVAIAAGGLAAFFATRGEAPVEPVNQAVEIREEPKTQVLVAARTIGIGGRLTPKALTWQDWPQSAVRPEYITSEKLPDAIEQMNGTVARFEIFVGEPIREARLATADSGYLSAVIAPGMRAVSVPVSAESAAGGFIVPNDRVDVILSRRGGIAETVLANVRVMAIGRQVGNTSAGSTSEDEDEEDGPAGFTRGTIATLELTPVQAETIVNAQSNGGLSLVLRSVVDFAETTADSARNGSSSVKLIRFGATRNVVSGVQETSEPAVSEDPEFAQQASQSPAPAPVDASQFVTSGNGPAPAGGPGAPGN